MTFQLLLSILNKDFAYILYTVATVSAKSSFDYYWHGPRLPSWDLRMQVTLDFTNDDEIENIDIYQMTQTMRERGLKSTAWPIDKGIYRAHTIDTKAFAGVGVGEDGLVRLTEEDRAAEQPRTIGYEVVLGTAAMSALEPYATDADRLCSIQPLTHRSFAGEASQQAQMRAMTIDYRLTPTHPFPAQTHDTLIAYLYLLQEGFKPENIIVAGDSSGAHMSIIAAPGALVLVSPWTDLVSTKPSMESNRLHDYLIIQPLESSLNYARMLFAPGKPLTDKMRQDMQGMLVGGGERLLDDVKALAAKINSQNSGKPGPVALEIYDDMPHVFHVLFGYRKETRDAFQSIGEFAKGI
ncbi:alpha/beta-hydrolase [Linderina pennispora]|uniref:Alpha/beta-hydrolase n=1 Tax=Linderina pennispora TaxID=61395 RepID=A0A1Y1WB18_9FUNG|nr:alpha/beta-hydrolase [Linderina pennispora]ORX70723.1 alpha/beta-hydrolase [Linderina pennispora]